MKTLAVILAVATATALAAPRLQEGEQREAHPTPPLPKRGQGGSPGSLLPPVPPAVADVPASFDAPADAELPANPVRLPRPRLAPQRNDGPAVAELPESLIAGDGPTLILVIGAAGAPEYGRQFAEWADRWEHAANQANARVIRIGGAPAPPLQKRGQGGSREYLRTALAELSADSSPHELWLVFLGHGTFDGRTPRFNLDGPDITDADLAAWLDPIERPVAVVQCASCSGAFLPKLSKPGRVVITATKSGSEHNVCRFGEHLSQAVTASDADLDHDGQTSLLEAWLLACRRTDESYFAEGRIPTEHALLDDNGDGMGVRPDAFHGVRPVALPAPPLQNGGRGRSRDDLPAPPLQKGGRGGSRDTAPGPQHADGRRAHQLCFAAESEESRLPSQLRHRRDELELQVLALRDRRNELAPQEYDRQLETLLVDLARLYETAFPLRTAGHIEKAGSRE